MKKLLLNSIKFCSISSFATTWQQDLDAQAAQIRVEYAAKKQQIQNGKNRVKNLFNQLSSDDRELKVQAIKSLDSEWKKLKVNQSGRKKIAQSL